MTLSLLTSLLFGMVPALRASAASPGAALKSGAMQHSRRAAALRWMLAAEIGFSVAVLFLCGLLLRSFQRLTSVDLGFTSDHVVLFDLGPRQASRESPRPTSASGLLKLVRRLPGVQAASISLQRPMGGDMVWIQTPFIRLPGLPNETVRPREVPVSPGFFDTMRIRWIWRAATSSPKRALATPHR